MTAGPPDEPRTADATPDPGTDATPDTGADATPDPGAAATSDDRSGTPPAGRRRLLLQTAVAALVVVAAIVAVALTQDRGAGTTAGEPASGAPPLLTGESAPATGGPLPDVTLPPLAGHGPAGGRDLTELTGEPLLVNFWATWCAPCVNEMPLLQRVSEQGDVTLVGINYIDRADEADALADELGITYELLRDDDGSFGDRIGVLGMPTTLLVDTDGTVVGQLTGEVTEEQLQRAIEELLL